MTEGSTIALALSAVFDLCVPGVSSGQLKQTFPPELLAPLTANEKKDYAEAIEGQDRAYHILSDQGFILMTTKGGFCRIITADGSTEEAASQFRSLLKARNGVVDKEYIGEQDYRFINGMIPLRDGYAIALVF